MEYFAFCFAIYLCIRQSGLFNIIDFQLIWIVDLWNLFLGEDNLPKSPDVFISQEMEYINEKM